MGQFSMGHNTPIRVNPSITLQPKKKKTLEVSDFNLKCYI
jgi:hypothetical protein